MKIEKLGILILLFCISGFISCDNEENEEGRKVTDYKEYELTVASKMVPGVLYSSGSNILTDVYAVKKDNDKEWQSFGNIGDFEFDEGYEYKIRISETSYQDNSRGDPAWTEYNLLEVISKVEKESEDVPLHLIPDWYYKDRFPSKYRYAVEADDKGLIEEDLKTNPILPSDYHYMLYRKKNGLMACIALKDESNVFGPYFVKMRNTDDEELPDSYKLLQPDGQVAGLMEWTFLDENGNETEIPSFDAFLGYSSKARDFMVAFDVAYLYKDLTELYKSKYPTAGIKTVVVSYTMAII